MRTLIAISIISIFLINIGCASTGTKHTSLSRYKRERIKTRVKKAIVESDPNVNIGISITQLNTGEVIYEKNSNRHFIPASVVKLITVASALHYLGPSFRFKTHIFTDGISKNGEKIKNLYIKGSGDPALMDYHLISLAFELKQMGIKKVSGHIFVDDTIFDSVLWGKGAMWDDRQYGYSAPVSGLNLNYNRILIKTRPAFRDNRLAHAIIRPATSFIDVTSKAKTKGINQSRLISLSIERDDGEERDWPLTLNEGLYKGDKIFIFGQTPINADPYYSLLAVKNPSLLAGTFFKEQLKNIGLKVKGDVLRSKVPDDATVLTWHTSRPLSESLIDFTKISNNVANDCLVKAIAAHHDMNPATADAGMKLIKKFLNEKVGIKTNAMVAVDGSGASRYNLVTPNQMVTLLNYAANNFDFAPEFLAALPIAGQDGTLSDRFNQHYLTGKIRAKTGSMSGVTSLAGFINGPLNNTYSFAIMINGFVGSVYKYQAMQDDIISAILYKKEEKAIVKR